MASKTGIWSVEEALEHHDFSYRLAKFIGDYFEKQDIITDFGCGRGTYLRYLHDRGYENLHGVEGEALPFFEFSDISVRDLTQPFQLDDIGHSICIEVGEHIPQEFADQFIKNIANNTSRKLIISWAIPGQDGIGHVNCKHNVWVIDRFEALGFKLDAEDTIEIRQHVDNNMSYLRNTLMIFNKI
jgi:hypothetical protein